MKLSRHALGHPRRSLNCLSMSAAQACALSLYHRCMKKISGRKRIITRNGFRGKCQCFTDRHAIVTLQTHVHGSAVCLSAGQSPPYSSF